MRGGGQVDISVHLGCGGGARAVSRVRANRKKEDGCPSPTPAVQAEITLVIEGAGMDGSSSQSCILGLVDHITRDYGSRKCPWMVAVDRGGNSNSYTYIST